MYGPGGRIDRWTGEEEVHKTGGQASRLIRKELECDAVRTEPYCLGRRAFVDGVDGWVGKGAFLKKEQKKKREKRKKERKERKRG